MSESQKANRERRLEASDLAVQVEQLRAEMLAVAAESDSKLWEIHADHRPGARNLLHYLALRRHDLRTLQTRLAKLGLSSLGRSEPHVLQTIDSVLTALKALAGDHQPHHWPEDAPSPIGFDEARKRLADHAERLLGRPAQGRDVRIMVTLPSEAAGDPQLVRDLVASGTDCVRINCAHDGPDEWGRMIAHLRSAEKELGKSCRIAMDLAGPKLRTGSPPPGPRVLRIRPTRDEFGRVSSPALVRFVPEGSKISDPESEIPATPSWVARLAVKDRIQLVDARGASRTLRVVKVDGTTRIAELRRTTYFTPETILRHLPHSRFEPERVGHVGTLEPLENALLLRKGDRLALVLDENSATALTSSGEFVPAIPCPLPELFESVQPGEPIRFDDGKIGGVIEEVAPDRILVRIQQVRESGEKLRADKGINLPVTELKMPALTSKDREDLKFVAANADIVALSFVNRPEDVVELIASLQQLTTNPPAIVLKIETRRGFESLPALLAAAMRVPRCGVMIARGDLAAECGFERLAELQEEILWICEAAHVPAIWATQVLERLAKEGTPTRAEISDAAMAHRAECVMLNKGPHILGALKALDDILRRMAAHQEKKRSMMRALHVARGLFT